MAIDELLKMKPEKILSQELISALTQNHIHFLQESNDDVPNSKILPLFITKATGDFKTILPVTFGSFRDVLHHGSETSYILHLKDAGYVYKFYRLYSYEHTSPRPLISVAIDPLTLNCHAQEVARKLNINTPPSNDLVDALVYRLEKINLHNELFSQKTKYTPVGLAFEEDLSERTASIHLVVKQPFIQFIPNSYHQAMRLFMQDMTNRYGTICGCTNYFEPDLGKALCQDWIIGNNFRKIDDLKHANIGIDIRIGVYAVIDCIIHTPTISEIGEPQFNGFFRCNTQWDAEENEFVVTSVVSNNSL
jgi:hypothetical protein